MGVTCRSSVKDISVVTLIRTDTTLDHSQKAEKVCQRLLHARGAGLESHKAQVSQQARRLGRCCSTLSLSLTASCLSLSRSLSFSLVLSLSLPLLFPPCHPFDIGLVSCGLVLPVDVGLGEASHRWALGLPEASAQQGAVILSSLDH